MVGGLRCVVPAESGTLSVRSRLRLGRFFFGDNGMQTQAGANGKGSGSTLRRCGWADESSLYRAYHDREWGVPEHDDNKLFELLVLEGAQAGLSWAIILGRREGYRQLFEQFDPRAVAEFTPDRIAKLLKNPAIVRNRAKVESAVANARAFVDIQKRYGSFDQYIWQMVGGRPLQNHWRTLAEVPASTVQSEAMSKALKKQGFTFVGKTICYAFMQAVGLVNDHTTDCFRHAECSVSRQ